MDARPARPPRAARRLEHRAALAELAAAYGGELPDGVAPSPDGFVAAEQDPAAGAAYEARLAALRGAPVRLEVPTDLPRPDVADGRGVRLPVDLDAAQRDATGAVAAACGVTRNAVLLAAWALVVSRRTGATDLLIGVPGVGRLGERSRAAVGLGSTLVPVRCRVGGPVRAYVAGVAGALGEALAGVRVPVERLAAALGAAGDPARNPLVQIGFAAHDELVPARLEGGGLVLELHEGHCGGTVFDAIVFVQRWGSRPRLALEYAPAALGPTEAAGLAAELGAALTGLAEHLDGQLAGVPALTAAQRHWLDAAGRGGPGAHRGRALAAGRAGAPADPGRGRGPRRRDRADLRPAGRRGGRAAGHAAGRRSASGPATGWR